MRDGFLLRFIENEYYLQNMPLDTDKFVNYCKNRGVDTNEKELEFFEREGLFYPIIRIDKPIGEEEIIIFAKDDGKMYTRPLKEGLIAGEKEIRKDKRYYYSSYNFSSFYKEMFLGWIKAGIMFDPSRKPFQTWSSFIGEELMFDNKKIVSLYSSHQIYWLYILKKSYCYKLNLAGDAISIFSAVSNSYWFLSETGPCELSTIEDFYSKLKKLGRDDLFKYYFDIDCKKEKLKNDFKHFELLLEFLISIQNVYTPYGRSGAKEIQITNTFPRSTEWEVKRKAFNPNDSLKALNLDIRSVVHWYKHFSRKAIDLLGGERYDFAQLWKNIRWSIKDDLKGNFRMGVEFLQWALMLKVFIEDYLGRKIFDIDEVINCTVDLVLECDIHTIEGCFNLRGVRNRNYSDEDKNYWDDKYKRLFYLANQFGFDYQPRIMVFVEGETEERVLPKIFEWYFDAPQDHGIEIIGFKGVEKLISTSTTAKQLRDLITEIRKDDKIPFLTPKQSTKLNKIIDKLERMNIIFSNWSSFIHFNLEKWQIIPFFIADYEGSITKFLDYGRPIKFGDDDYNVPRQWRYLWGVDNDNKPFIGNNFELANFTDSEIKVAIDEVLDGSINIEKIIEIRSLGLGINELDERVDAPGNKIKIANILINNLFKNYQDRGDSSISDRPVFIAIRKIIEIAASNKPPMNRMIEIENKKIIYDILKSGE
ncbi:Uncharacterised protein [uncultured archaeon]|nr:Uncharacterised protein [uncultured archaeon]